MNRGTQRKNAPTPPTGPHRVRGGAVGQPPAGHLLGVAVGLAALLLLLAPARQASALVPGAARADDVLLVLIAWVGVGLAGWLALGSLLGVLALLPGTAGRLAGEVAERVTPLAVRRLLTFTLGAAVGSCALPAAPVSNAATAPVAAGRTGAGPAPQAPSGDLLPGFVPTGSRPPLGTVTSAGGARTRVDDGPGFTPTLEPAAGRRVDAPSLAGPASRASETAPRATAPGPVRGPGYLPTAPPRVHDAERPRLLAPAPRAGHSTHELVTVRRGDSLWSIASRHLGPGASDVQVAHEWPRWYTANRDVIGDDPDLLVPGQQLRPPEVATTALAPGAGR